MKTSFVAFATLSLIGACSAQNANANANAQVNANGNAADAGSVAMDRLMSAKVNSRNKCRKTGLCGKPPKGVGNRKKTKCVNGMAGEFPCKVRLISWLRKRARANATTAGYRLPLVPLAHRVGIWNSRLWRRRRYAPRFARFSSPSLINASL